MARTTLAVVGTGTGVGKTVVTAGVTGWLRDAGVDALAVKPAQTVHPPATLTTSVSNAHHIRQRRHCRATKN